MKKLNELTTTFSLEIELLSEKKTSKLKKLGKSYEIMER